MSLATEIQRLDPSQIVSLYELSNYHNNDVFRFTNIGNVVWGGVTYQALPVESDGWEYTGKGTLPRPKIRVSNVSGTMSLLLQQYGDLAGATLTRRRTLQRYLMNPPSRGATEFPPDVYTVTRKTVENKKLVEFELQSVLDREDVELPRRIVLASTCTWQYRGANCGYTGTQGYDINNNPTSDPNQDTCNKTLAACKRRFGLDAVLNFGSYVGLTRQ